MLRSRRATPIQDIVDGATTEDRADCRQDHRLRIGATEHLDGKGRTRGERDRELGAIVGRSAGVKQKPRVGGLLGLDALDDLGPFALELTGILDRGGLGGAGGSNLGGLISPFMGEKLRGERDYQFIAVEPASCPSFTRGKFAYDFCDTGKVCPLAKMYTLGSNFIPSANHAGGLRYHGMSPVLSELYHEGLMEARAVEQTKVFEAAEQFARVEGILPAPESSHAIRVAIDEAMKCKETGEEKTIVFGLTGTGYFDMVAYEKFHNGQMTDYIPTDAELEASFAQLPKVPGQD